MSLTHEQLSDLMKAPEGEHFEFKEAKTRYDFEELVQYCVALANERGGKIVLGVTDKRPRRIVGSLAFPDLERTRKGVFDRLRFKVETDELNAEGKRVVVFNVPPRPLGVPVQYKGRYLMRAGDELTGMTPDQLKAILDEAVPDYSAQVCPGAKLDDLDPAALSNFADKWARKSGKAAYRTMKPAELLRAAEILFDGGVTYAALVLFGTKAALGRHLPQAEVVFEFRSSEGSTAHQQRISYRLGLFSFIEDLAKVVGLRNEVQQFQDGFFKWDIPTFNDQVVREVVLNAVAHRDYRLPGSIFVKQYPRKLEVVSPGGFPAGITVENVLWRHSPRNRRIAEALEKCGLVERSGQGVDTMFGECIKEGKPRPDFSGTDEHQVMVTIHGEVQDRQFLRFLEKVGQEKSASFDTNDLLVLDRVHRGELVPAELKQQLPRLVELGVIEAQGRGKGTRYLLSRKFYSFLGKKGSYTRKRGLDRDTQKALLLKHVQSNPGCPLNELMQVLPELSRGQIQTLLSDMRTEEQIHPKGTTRAALWFPGRK